MPKNLYLRAGIYWARFKVRGISYRESLRTRSERVAVKRLAARMEEVQDQAIFGIAGPVSWPEAVVSWNASLADSLGAATFRRYTASLRQLRGWLDEKSIQEVDVELVREIVKARKRAGVKNATIRRDLTALSSVLNHAIDEGWLTDNAAIAINRRRIVPERVVRIVLPTDEVLAEMLPRLPSRMADMVEFARETGLRLSECTALRHAAIRADEGAMTVENGKGGKVRAVTLTPHALQIVQRQPRYIGKPHVFWRMAADPAAKPARAGETVERAGGLPFKDVSSRIAGYMRRRARKAAQAGEHFEGFSFHDMRHLFAVEYLRKGRGSIYDLQRELGHDSITTTERYLAFLTPEEAKAAREGVAQQGARALRFGAENA